jgi:hypothetical protein
MACIGKRRGVQRVLVGKPEGKGTIEKPKLRLEIILKYISQN